MNKTIVLIDAANFYHTCGAIGLRVDYSALRSWCETHFSPLYEITWFTGVPDKTAEVNAIHRVLDWLEFNGFSIVRKPVKIRDVTDRDTGEEKTVVTANMDVEITIRALTVVYSGTCDNVVLFSGDGDFVPLVDHLRALGVRVTVVSTRGSPGGRGHCSDNLRRATHQFVDLDDLRDEITYTSTTEATKIT